MGKTSKKNSQGYVDFGEKPSKPNKAEWDHTFTPSYTPAEMLEMGVFEGKYINAIKGLPGSWYSIKKVLKKNEERDPEINYFGVKSRQSLSEWKKNGGLTVNSEFGWFHWYCLYFLGRRLEEEDKWQIKRWRALISRHQAQIDKKCRPKDHDCNRTQRQAMLQWAWNSDTSFNDAQQTRNRNRLAGMSGIHMGEESKASNESMLIIPPSAQW